MTKKKMHKERVMGAWVTTECLRNNVDRSQIAAFPEGVTCQKCLAAIKWNEENSIVKPREDKG